MSDTPEYRIEHVRDFLKVPVDRLDACLKEFAVFVEMASATMGIVDAIGGGAQIGAFVWRDDGLRNVTINIRTEEPAP